ncbi:hypothetical protein AB7Y49_05080 [Providencia vermicola]|uniref:Uncharacterized protein n=1 Tax=Providencia vermicola TaxID=333965 RepID=A0AAX3RR16_9GAMM|nr:MULTISPECIES: hypothetical protein [Providencia]ELX8378111.1 hypothetical protein [Providencia stuartii]EMD5259449.1 hypothetical protein [Providencia stuartii]USB36086.1 hypothetical protein M5J11_14890 [Providencia vermicola]WFC05082.1 hypothetical protein PG365_10005 [Providencia vermicola]
MADINATDFYKGALWAADILVSTSSSSSSHHYQNEVRDILEHIPNLYSIVMQTPETEVCDLRLLVDKEFPLGRHADYVAIDIVPLSQNNDIVAMPEKVANLDEMSHSRADIACWGVAAKTADEKQKLLITGLHDSSVAQSYALRLTEQLNRQKG